MKIKNFLEILGTDFYAGVPDSQLKALCNYLIDEYGTDPHHHIIAANEGNAAALAAGYHLATGKTAVVYMQNSGEGNIINPLASLLNEKVYAIPAIFIIGWRGEPGVHDEPQHKYQGEVTKELMDVMGVPTCIIDKETTDDDIRNCMEGFRKELEAGRDVAFIVRKGGLTYEGKPEYKNSYGIRREEIIRVITEFTGEDPIISTTGKTSRELFELREANGQGHGFDFLTVGSMGHSSSIALGAALQRKDQTIWCIDGDGAALMHMGAMAVIGAAHPDNLIHIVINNEAHESVGGQPTCAGTVDFEAIGKACGYDHSVSVNDLDSLRRELAAAKERKALTLIEMKSAIGARDDLGRPTTTPQDNKHAFMEHLNK